MLNSQVWIKLLLVLILQIEMIAMEPAWHEGSEGKTFLIDTEEKYNWYQAWNECARYDAQLIAIESELKNEQIMKLLKNINEKNKNFWIGGNVFYNKISFLWAANEQEFSFTNWVSDEADKFATSKKQCVYLMRNRKNFPWNIVDCDTKEFGFICEKIVIPSEELLHAENVSERKVLKGAMYNGSIYGIIG